MKLGPDQYIFTEEGDQIGYLNQAYTGSIGFDFLLDPYGQGPWSTAYGNGDEVPEMWERIQFDQSWLPYNFAIGLRYDTGIALFSIVLVYILNYCARIWYHVLCMC